jgi:pimeloyl-ACP methyl ester carboxylesterase
MLRLLALVILALLAGCSLLLEPLEQEFLFRNRPVSAERYAAILARDPYAEEVRLTVDDGVKLHGILKRAATRPGERYPLVVVFGGVARETSWMASWGEKPPAWGWLMVNYRGYGLSEGRPTERALLDDARAVYDWAARRPDVDPRRIVVLGRSLGSYVAVALAAQRPVRGLILATPFDSLEAIAGRRYPMLPAGLILNGRYDSAVLAPRIAAPALFVLAEEDDVTPIAHGEALAKVWGGPKNVVTLHGAGHRGLEWQAGYWSAIGEFLGRIDAQGRLPGEGTVQK